MEILTLYFHFSTRLKKAIHDTVEPRNIRNLDPYQSLNISVMDEGGCQQWHFDGGNMVTTLLLQAHFLFVRQIKRE